MSITYNDTLVESVDYNETNLNSVYYNTVKVFEKAPETCLCFTANTAGSTVTINVSGTPTLNQNFQYKIGNSWEEFIPGTTVVTLANIGDRVYFKGNNPFGLNESNFIYYYFSLTGSVKASGNIMSLIDNGDCTTTIIPNDFCFAYLFSNCNALVTAPVLPATTLTTSCYKLMFTNCTSLIEAPALPATTLAEGCYVNMFYTCTSLTIAPALPAEILIDICYVGMFAKCTSLVNPPIIAATTAAPYCCYCMFQECTSLLMPPVLHMTTLANNCCTSMFDCCFALTTALELPATVLAPSCYYQMFMNCTSLVSAPELPAMVLAESCYYGMFAQCTSLTTVPELPATVLKNQCYWNMFKGCSSLIVSDGPGLGYYKEWRLPEVNTFEDTSSTQIDMFMNCKIGSGRSSDNLVANVGEYKLYYTNGGMPPMLAFTANAAGSTVAISQYGTPTLGQNFQYSVDNQETWIDYSFTTDNLNATTITLANVGDKVYFKGNNPNGLNESISTYFNFVLTKSIAASGNIMSLIDNGACITKTIPNDYCFNSLFSGCNALTSAPELPAINLTVCCYYSLFKGCSILTNGPALPAEILKDSCYASMFRDCISLKLAPELKSETLAKSCYEYMFRRCLSLSSAPELPATQLAESCYMGLFQSCTSLTSPPALPAGRLAENCYSMMFYGCTSFTVSDEYGIGYYKEWRIPTEDTFTNTYLQSMMFTGCQGKRSKDSLVPIRATAKVYYTNGGFPPVLTFTSNTDGSTVKLISDGTPTITRNFQSSIDGGRTWQNYTIGTVITLSNVGDKVSFRGNNPTGLSESSTIRYKFVLTGRITASGNIMSLIDNGACITKTIPNDYCFGGLFESQGALVNASKLILNSTVLKPYCYSSMFAYCSNLTDSPELPATTMANYCYQYMFYNCSALIKPPALPAENIAEGCYNFMFRGCSNLTIPPALNATTIYKQCYQAMFQSCTKLTVTPTLPAETLAEECYKEMFSHCTSLVNASAVSASSLARESCKTMFYNCKKLVNFPPEFNPTQVSQASCQTMFGFCESLTSVPSLLATKLTTECYNNMFYGCTSLYVSDTPAVGYYRAWRIPTVGTFSNEVNQAAMFTQCQGTRTSDNLEPIIDTYKVYYTNGAELIFTANVDNSTVSVIKSGTPTLNPTFNYSTDLVNWNVFIPGTTSAIVLDIGDRVYFKGNNPNGINNSELDYYGFKLTGNISVSGSVMGLIDNGESSATTIPSDYCFFKLFYGQSALTDASNLILNATVLTESCYRGMFSNCSALKTTPELPATVLAPNCYNRLFANCTSLTKAPRLSATTLAKACYRGMFDSCYALTFVPPLKASTLTESCYQDMFYCCTALVNMPIINASTLAENCCRSMFEGCISLSAILPLNASTLAKGCYYGMFRNCSALVDIPNLPATTLADQCYSYMFENCTALATIPELPAVALSSSCYDCMFYGCTSLYISDTPKADYRKEYHIPSVGTFTNNNLQTNMFTYCQGTRSTNNLVPTIGTYKTYYIFGNQPLTFTAKTAGSTVSLKKNGTPTLGQNFQYSTDGKTWNTFTPGSTSAITLSNVGSKVYFRGNNPNGVSESAGPSGTYFTFVLYGNISVSGSVMSLIDYDATTTTIPNNCCFYMLFYNQLALTDASELVLNATTLNNSCYHQMFSGTKIISAPALPALTLADYCYYGMFERCTFLTQPPVLPAITAFPHCYHFMFSDCTKLTTAPKLPALILADYCYYGMFDGCTKLTSAPELSATTLARDCYHGMFYNCTSLESAGEISATTLADSSCYMMYINCSKLIAPPVFKPTTLATNCCYAMFAYCESMTSVPKLPATTLVSGCYEKMFKGCTSLIVSDVADQGHYNKWQIPTSGTFTNSITQTDMFLNCSKGIGSRTTDNLVPTTGNYKTYYVNGGVPQTLTFTSNKINSTIGMKVTGTLPTSLNFQYSTNGGSWNTFTPGTTTITLPIIGSQVQFRGNNPSGINRAENIYVSFVLTGDISISGSVMGLLDNGACTTTTVPEGSYCFAKLFENQSKLTDISKLDLSATTLSVGCYKGMFSSCTSITTAPKLNAKTLAAGCYSEMFFNCTSLTTAPALPAETLVNDCYQGMFSGCTALTTAPALSATTLSTRCYMRMFQDCKKLVSAPALPATKLENSCYSYMFNNCISLTASPILSATQVASQCCSSMFEGCSSLTTVPELTSTTLAENCYDRMFYRCTNITATPNLPATTLAMNCYYQMFLGCTKLTEVSALPALIAPRYCYYTMFAECTALATPPDLPATSVGEYSYFGMFRDCTNLAKTPVIDAVTVSQASCAWLFESCKKITDVPNLKPTTLATNCYKGMFSGCTSLYVADEPLPEYYTSWYIPISGTFTNALTQSGMFTNCLGTRASDNLVVAAGSQKQYYIKGGTYPGLTFTATQANSKVAIEKQGSPTLGQNFQYSVGGPWQTFVPGTTTITLVNVGDKVYFRGDNPNGLNEGSESNYYKFSLTGRLKVSGNIMSLIDNGKCTTTDIPNDFCFCKLFDHQLSLKDASELILNATTLKPSCYREMFKECYDLAKTPLSLPAIDLKEYCYYHMFEECAAIKVPPDIKAFNLEKYCMASMFAGCDKLIKPPTLNAYDLPEACYQLMFYGCGSLIVSDTPGTGYTQQWSIPTQGLYSYWVSDQLYMFQICAGTRSSNHLKPVPNDASLYYTNDPT